MGTTETSQPTSEMSAATHSPAVKRGLFPWHRVRQGARLTGTGTTMVVTEALGLGLIPVTNGASYFVAKGVQILIGGGTVINENRIGIKEGRIAPRSTRKKTRTRA